jgi:hypothetical protein
MRVIQSAKRTNEVRRSLDPRRRRIPRRISQLLQRLALAPNLLQTWDLYASKHRRCLSLSLTLWASVWMIGEALSVPVDPQGFESAVGGF